VTGVGPAVATELENKVHTLETGLAAQEAAMTGAQATRAATRAGMTTTFAATQTGTRAVMGVDSVAVLVGTQRPRTACLELQRGAKTS
jgi:hypothetical protein